MSSTPTTLEEAGKLLIVVGFALTFAGLLVTCMAAGAVIEYSGRVEDDVIGMAFLWQERRDQAHDLLIQSGIALIVGLLSTLWGAIAFAMGAVKRLNRSIKLLQPPTRFGVSEAAQAVKELARAGAPDE